MKCLLALLLVSASAFCVADQRSAEYAPVAMTTESVVEAIETGDLKLPPGVTVSWSEVGGKRPRVQFSGEGAAVDKAVLALQALDRAPMAFSVGCVVYKDGKQISKPSLLVLSGKAATVTQSSDGLASGIRIRVGLSHARGLGARVSVCWKGVWVYVPSPIVNGDVVRVSKVDGTKLTVTTVSSGSHVVDTFTLPDSCSAFAGMTYTFSIVAANTTGKG